MAADDPKDSEELQRKQTLEEIRRRAEEAELKRIEELERQAGDATPPVRTTDRSVLDEVRRRAEQDELRRLEEERVSRSQPPPPLPPPPPRVELPPPPLNVEPPTPPPPVESELDQLRNRLSIALDRGRLEKATALFEEFSEASPDEDEIEEFRERLKALESDQQRAKRKKKAVEGRGSTEREAAQRKIKELLEKANEFYQQEKYQKGLDGIQEVLKLDENNEDALVLREQIQKAQQLAEQIKAEVERRRAEQRGTAPPPTPEPTVPIEGEDIWGPKEVKVEEEEEERPEEESAPAPPEPPLIVKVADKLSRIRIPKKVINGIIITIALAALVYLVDTARRQAFQSELSLVVFPAEVAETDDATRFLADGIMHDVITELGRTSDLRLIGPMSSLALQSGIPAARSIGANHYLQSRITKAANTIEVQLALFDTSSQESIWQMQFVRPLDEVLLLEDEITRSVLGALRIRFAGADGTPATNPEAVEAYARGYAMLLRPSDYPVTSAKGAFASSVKLDPRFGKAWVSYGWTHLLEFEEEIDADPAHLDTAWSAAQEAHVVGLKSGCVFRLMGVVEQNRGQYDEALGHLENAISLGPASAESRRRIAELYAIRGRNEEALEAARRAALDDPLNVGTLTTFGMIQQFLGDYRGALVSYEAASRLVEDPDEYKSGHYIDVLVYLNQPERAVEVLQDRIRENPESFMDHYKLGRIYQSVGGSLHQWKSALEKARDILEAGLRNDPQDARAHALLSLVRVRLGRYTDALESKNRALELSPKDPIVLMNIARMHTIHREKTEALDFLRRALEQRYQFAPVLDMDFYNLHSDTDFLAAIKR